MNLLILLRCYTFICRKVSGCTVEKSYTLYIKEVRQNKSLTENDDADDDAHRHEDHESGKMTLGRI